MLVVIWICATLITVVSGNICEKTHCDTYLECDCSGGNYDELGFEQADVLQFTDNNLKLLDIFNKTVVKSQLNLNNNLISRLDNIPKTLHNLNLLYLVNNELTYIAANTFSKFKRLRDLRLSHNKISSIDTNAFKGAMLLETLNLSNNHINSITFVNHLPKIISLTLSHNVITDLSPIENANLSLLNTLHLNDNKIVNITINIFRNMANFSTVHLENNKIPNENYIDLRKLKFNLTNKNILTVELNSYSICCKIEEIIGYNKTCLNCTDIFVPPDSWISRYKFHIMCSGVILIVILLLGIGTYFVGNMICTKRNETVHQDQVIQEGEKIKPLQPKEQPEEDPDGYLQPNDLHIYEEIKDIYSAVRD